MKLFLLDYKINIKTYMDVYNNKFSNYYRQKKKKKLFRTRTKTHSNTGLALLYLDVLFFYKSVYMSIDF